jgi:hypothetical protein
MNIFTKSFWLMDFSEKSFAKLFVKKEYLVTKREVDDRKYRSELMQHGGRRFGHDPDDPSIVY